MFHLFSALNAKLYHWYQFTISCFGEFGFQVKEARELSKLAINVINLLPKSDKYPLVADFLDDFILHLMGIYFTTISHHDAIQSLTLSGHGLNCMMILRSQLEAVLIFLFITEPDLDLKQVKLRIENYLDWIKVKMKQNMERSSKLIFYIEKCNDDFKASVIRNYEAVLEKYVNNQQEFNRILRSSSFLKDKRSIAEINGIENLYEHIYSESSAAIHVADISDRMREDENFPFNIYSYIIRHNRGALWPLMLSNLLEVYAIRRLAKFFSIDSIVEPLLIKIFMKKEIKRDKAR
jgi:hypothetical protein